MEKHPAEMHPIELVAFWMLDQPRETRQQRGDAEAEHDADEDTDMQELIAHRRAAFVVMTTKLITANPSLALRLF